MASPELTRDGRRVANFARLTEMPTSGFSQPGEGLKSRFTFDPKVDGFPVWSSDGERILFASNLQGHFVIFERPAVGAGEDRPVVHSKDLSVPLAMDTSADGRFLLFAVKALETGIDLWAPPLTSHGAALPIAQTRFDEMAGQFSPDGKWVAYQSNASGRMEVYVTPFPRRGSQTQVSSAGGAQPRWAPDGNGLFYIAADDA